MTPPAAFDGAEFRRIAATFHERSAAGAALRYAATLAGELERARADAGMFKFLSVQQNDFHVEHWERGTWKVLRGNKLIAAINAAIKDCT